MEYFDQTIRTVSSSTDAGEALGTPRHRFIGFTLNYSPKFMFRLKGSNKQYTWGSLTPDQQVDIFDGHIDRIYKHHFDVVEYTFELTKEGNVHCHAMGTLKINPDHADLILWDIRKKVGQHPEVIKYTRGNMRHCITSNYIHYVEYDKWKSYIEKDLKKVPYKKRCITSY